MSKRDTEGERERLRQKYRVRKKREKRCIEWQIYRETGTRKGRKQKRQRQNYDREN